MSHHRVDINERGVLNGERLAAERGIADRARFRCVDATGPLPFPDASFDAVVSNDAIRHLANRRDVLSDWHRMVRPSGRILFTDALVVTGELSGDELSTRSSIGFYLFVPPGENERLLAETGFSLMNTEDLDSKRCGNCRRRYAAREQHRAALVAREGASTFDRGFSVSWRAWNACRRNAVCRGSLTWPRKRVRRPRKRVRRPKL